MKMRIGEVALRLAVSRVHAWRIAKSGIIPGTKKTKAGQFYFVRTSALEKWLNETAIIGSARRRKEMKRAYGQDYGSGDHRLRRLRRHYLTLFMREDRKQRFHRGELNRASIQEYFESFLYAANRLDEIVKDLRNWGGSKGGQWELADLEIKRKLRSLRESINAYLSATTDK